MSAQHSSLSTNELTLERASLYLASRARVRTPLGAAEYLDCLRHHQQENYDRRLQTALDCLAIYRSAFPDQYASSPALPFSIQREHEFYTIVDKRCFPLAVDDENELEDYLEREPRFFLPFIPVRGLQEIEWVEGGFNFAEIDLPYQLALLLSGWTDDGGPATVGGLRSAVDFPRPAPPLGGLGWSLFVHACRVDGSPLNLFPAAFGLVNYKTGNLWLDLPRHVGFLGQAWTAENVAKLTVERMQASQYDIAMRKLYNWLNEDTRARVTRAITLWNEASRKEAEWGLEGLVEEELMQAGMERFGWAPVGENMLALPDGEIERLWNGEE